MGHTVTAQFAKAIILATSIPMASFEENVREWLSSNSTANRVSLALIDEIWRDCVLHSNDELFGLRAGLTIQIGDLDVVGFMLMSCESMAEAIDTLIDYHQIVGEGGGFSFLQEKDVCCLQYSEHYSAFAQQRVGAVVGAIVNLSSWLSNKQFRVHEVEFSYPRPALGLVEDTQALLECRVRYGQSKTSIFFDSSMLALPIAQSNSEVYKRMRLLADETMENLMCSRFSYAVSGLIRLHPTKNKEQIANLLNVSGRHLNRKLAIENTHFKELQDTVRKQLAERWLREKRHPQDVSEELGFCDTRSFSKAFKRWSGLTPAQFMNASNRRKT